MDLFWITVANKYEVHTNQETGTAFSGQLLLPIANTRAITSNSSKYFSYEDKITNTSVRSILALNHDFYMLSLIFSENTKATSNNSSEYYSYTDKITNKFTNPPQSYKINGIAQKTKVGNKTIINFNGTGFKTVTITDSEGLVNS